MMNLEQINNSMIYAPLGYEEDFKRRILNDAIKNFHITCPKERKLLWDVDNAVKNGFYEKYKWYTRTKQDYFLNRMIINFNLKKDLIKQLEDNQKYFKKSWRKEEIVKALMSF